MRRESTFIAPPIVEATQCDLTHLQQSTLILLPLPVIAGVGPGMQIQVAVPLPVQPVVAQTTTTVQHHVANTGYHPQVANTGYHHAQHGGHSMYNSAMSGGKYKGHKGYKGNQFKGYKYKGHKHKMKVSNKVPIFPNLETNKCT